MRRRQGYIEHDNALLDDVLSSLGEANQQGDHPKTNETILLPEVEYLHIYCDILRVSVTQDGALLAVAPAPIQWLRIFARSIKTIDSHGHQGEQPLQSVHDWLQVFLTNLLLTGTTETLQQ